MGGAQRSMTGEASVYYPEIHGLHGLGPIVPSSDIAFRRAAFWIHALIKRRR
ncbi:hypothetical protein [Bacillus pseudomycoides]|uniref:hypothetical protein n=1 Tax=Bacillus pseudomycoides TaxID=64104 RepID=UPI001596C873|nr:hypothetical protein [Bacillus pseudomycoides]MED1475346.1 hypothetical protein [Bacillus pseudomycoides]MED1535911.1 hypothetical protein [Bacillus pseudomycoides]MED1620581.1 hypothetical protein [Bacillus pseudomycoides]